MTQSESSEFSEAAANAVKVVIDFVPSDIPAEENYESFWKLYEHEIGVRTELSSLRYEVECGNLELTREMRQQLHAKAKQLGDHWAAEQIRGLIASSKVPLSARQAEWAELERLCALAMEHEAELERAERDFERRRQRGMEELDASPEDMKLCGKNPRKRRMRDRERRECSSYYE